MKTRTFDRRALALVTLTLGALVTVAACSSPVGGPVMGKVDAHCGSTVQPTSQASCHPSMTTGTGGGSGGSGTSSSTSTGTGGGTGGSSSSSSTGAGTGGGTGGGAGGGDSGGSDYGPTMFNAEGDDDDCKYHVSWTATAIRENENVTFTVVATNKTDGSPLKGASVLAEVYLNDTHPGPNTNQKAPEGPTGTYAVGPVRFDAAGQWTVRFHFFEECSDLNDDSPHGHAAFYVQVP
jgi:hypothetical protein